jgi:hypothetical protein
MNWKKTLLLSALGLAVPFSPLAPTAASTDAGKLNTPTTESVTDTAPGGPSIAVTDRGVIELREGHTLRARGIGDVTIVGRGKIQGAAFDGTLTIMDLGGNANIEVIARARRVNPVGSMTYFSSKPETSKSPAQS